MIIETFIADVIAQLEEVKIALDEATVEACNEIANTAVEILIKNAPYDEEEDNDTIPGEEGHLNESFSAIEAISTGDGTAQTAVQTNEPIKLQYVTEGTEEQAPIVPTTQQALWWPGVEHPVAYVSGQEPNPFVDESVVEINDQADAIIEGIFQPLFALLEL